MLGFFKCTLKITLFGRSDDDANFIVVHRVTTTQSVTATDSALTNAATTILPSTVTGKSSNFFEIFYETSPKYSLEDTLHTHILNRYIYFVFADLPSTVTMMTEQMDTVTPVQLTANTAGSTVVDTLEPVLDPRPVRQENMDKRAGMKKIILGCHKSLKLMLEMDECMDSMHGIDK